jgi:predicted nucleic acid-binding protein
MKFFFDTNVLVYLFDADSPDKRKKARALFQKHADAGDILLVQVLQSLCDGDKKILTSPGCHCGSRSSIQFRGTAHGAD